MKAIRNSLLCGVAAMALLAGAHHVLARTAPVSLAQASAPAAKPFTTEQLDQMLAPIALYPDSLLSQVLMAATYPLEVIEAARWSAANASLKGDAAVKAVEQKSWDVSVKSLVAFPQVLKQMNDQLEWTQSLGDAMLAQHTEVAASIQRLRKRAHDAGNLKTTQQQKVVVEPTPAVGGATTQTIVIEPASPQVVYVPVYQPTVVYGAWPYPAYPPAYYPPYPGYGYGAALATGFIWGAAIAGGGALYGGWGWRGGDVDIDINRAVNIDRNINRNNYQGGKWTHSPEHRKGAAYRDQGTRQKYGKTSQGADARQQFRGKDVNTMASQRPAGAGDRAGSAQQRQGGGGDRAGAGGQQRQAATQQRASTQQRGAFEGMDRGGQNMNREMSRGQSSYGGGGRSGGGGGGRGGGGRR